MWSFGNTLLADWLRHTSASRVHRYTDQVWGGSQLRPSEMDFEKLAFMQCMLRPPLLKPQWVILRGARFITWHLKGPFLEKCWQGPRHFWECQACLGYSHVPVPTLKKALCHTHPFVRACDKYLFLSISAASPACFFLSFFLSLYHILVWSIKPAISVCSYLYIHLSLLVLIYLSNYQSFFYLYSCLSLIISIWSLHCIMAKVLNCGMKVSKFKLQSL